MAKRGPTFTLYDLGGDELHYSEKELILSLVHYFRELHAAACSAEVGEREYQLWLVGVLTGHRPDDSVRVCVKRR